MKLTPLEFRWMVYGENPNYAPDPQADYNLWVDYHLTGNNPLNICHPKGLNNIELRQLPSERTLKKKYLDFGMRFIMQNWLKPKADGYDWPELEKHRYFNRWFAWWRWGAPEMRKQIAGPKVRGIKWAFGLPVEYTVEKELNPRVDRILFESQYAYLVRRSKSKHESQIWWEEAGYKRVRDVEQIYPSHKLY